ncbi:unnamed protein product [Mortierella alpina]
MPATILLLVPPTTPQANGSDPLFSHSFENSGSPFHAPNRDYSLSCFEVPDVYPPYVYPRHCSLGSFYPITQSHELLESFQAPAMCSGESTPMLSTSSSTSISSDASLPPKNPSCSVSASSKRRASTSKSRATRRASLSPESLGRLYPCIFDDCGKLFKRSEHLKRHVRSVHTLEKPYTCPYQACPKRFSRSDNLNQHIRVHRHDKGKILSQTFTTFSSF